jgi:hypothetical protein
LSNSNLNELSPSFFVSFTETPDEISLILDEETFKTLPPATNGMYISDRIWRGVQFSIGASPGEERDVSHSNTLTVDVKGFIRCVVEPLSKAGISIFYFYTFNTDFLLVLAESQFTKKCFQVEEKNFQAAKHCIKQNVNVVGLEEEEESTTLPSTLNAEPPKPSNVLENFSHLQVFAKLQ